MDQKTKEIFSARFRELREKTLNEDGKPISQAGFATFLGISRPTVGFYENGDRLPDADVIRKICGKCNVPSDWLLGLSDAKKPENSTIGSDLGLSDKAIDVLRQASLNGFRKIAYNRIIEDEKILRYITNYLFAFLESERKKSRFRNVPMARRLAPGYAEMNMVKLIELLPLWRKDMIDEIKADTETFDYLLTQYVANMADIPMCEYESGMVDLEEAYIPEPDDALPEDFYEDYDEDYDEDIKKFEADLRKKQDAIMEILAFINGKDQG